MSEETVQKFTNRLSNLINASRGNDELTYAELIGALEMAKLDIYGEASEDDD